MIDSKNAVFVSAKFKEITPGVLDVVIDEYYRIKLDENAVKYDSVTFAGSDRIVCREKLSIVHKQESVNAFGEKHLKFFLKVTPDSDVVIVATRHLSSNTTRLLDAIVDHVGAFTTINVTHEYKNNLLGLIYPRSSYTVC
jgi:hypothetical protein